MTAEEYEPTDPLTECLHSRGGKAVGSRNRGQSFALGRRPGDPVGASVDKAVGGDPQGWLGPARTHYLPKQAKQWVSEK